MRWSLLAFSLSLLLVAPGLHAAPNILLLVAEDLSPRVGAYGDQVAKTPTLDALAKRSMRYTNAYTTAGVCAPSRAALLMGQHQISFGAMHMRTTTGPLGEYLARPQAGFKAFPELLRQAGYFTYTDGKLDYQFSGVRAGSGPFSIWSAEGARAHWRQRPGGAPFFGLINFLQTHESGVMRLDVEPYSAKHAASQKMRHAANLIAKPVTDDAKVELPPYYPDLPEVRADVARHYDNIHAMDKQVAVLLRQLADDGLADNTIVIWTSDHGDGLPRAKRELYDSGLRVPLLVMIPTALRDQVPTVTTWVSGATDSRLVSFVDIAPTILALAGVGVAEEVRSHWHGQNFLLKQRQAIYASRDRIDEVMDRQRAVRDENFKYIRSWHPNVAGGHRLDYRDNLDMVRAMRAAYEQNQLDAAQDRWFEAVGDEQLYDLRVDPHELNNLANRADTDPELGAHRVRLRSLLNDWLVRVGDTASEPEPALRDRLLERGAIPQTPQPSASWRQGHLVLSDTLGASIGYRYADADPWSLYQSPLEPAGRPVQVKAVRYGWRESDAVTLTEEP